MEVTPYVQVIIPLGVETNVAFVNMMELNHSRARSIIRDLIQTQNIHCQICWHNSGKQDVLKVSRRLIWMWSMIQMQLLKQCWRIMYCAITHIGKTKSSISRYKFHKAKKMSALRHSSRISSQVKNTRLHLYSRHEQILINLLMSFSNCCYDASWPSQTCPGEVDVADPIYEEPAQNIVRPYKRSHSTLLTKLQLQSAL